MHKIYSHAITSHHSFFTNFYFSFVNSAIKKVLHKIFFLFMRQLYVQWNSILIQKEKKKNLISWCELLYSTRTLHQHTLFRYKIFFLGWFFPSLGKINGSKMLSSQFLCTESDKVSLCRRKRSCLYDSSECYVSNDGLSAYT